MTKKRLILAISLFVINVIVGGIVFFFHDRYELAYPNALWLYLLIPALSGIYFFRQFYRRESVNTSYLPEDWKKILPQLNRHLLFAIRLMTISFLIYVIARPQSSDSFEDLTREGINIVIAMDVSASMLSKDFEPNRLESAKEVAVNFVSERPDDRIGVVVYEGESITQVPLTSDHRVVTNGLAQLHTGQLTGGTAIGMGLATAVNRLKESEGKSKVVILLTDGVNNAGEIKPADAAQLASLYGIRVYTIGVGTIGKAKSPVGMSNGQYVYDWIEVEIDEETLKDIAEETGGKYFRATSKNKLNSIYQEIDQLEKTRFNVLQYNRKTEEFTPFLLIAIVLMLLEMALRVTVFRTPI